MDRLLGRLRLNFGAVWAAWYCLWRGLAGGASQKQVPPSPGGRPGLVLLLRGRWLGWVVGQVAGLGRGGESRVTSFYTLRTLFLLKKKKNTNQEYKNEYQALGLAKGISAFMGSCKGGGGPRSPAPLSPLASRPPPVARSRPGPRPPIRGGPRVSPHLRPP